MRQASLQKRTSSQQRAHFFRQRKGRWQVGQVFAGRFSFLTPRMPIQCSDSPFAQTGARIPASEIGIRPLNPLIIGMRRFLPLVGSCLVTLASAETNVTRQEPTRGRKRRMPMTKESTA